MQILLVICCLFNLLSAFSLESCNSCDLLKDIDKMVVKRKDIYDKQQQKILNIKNLNANYLLHLSGSNFELNKENRLIFIYGQFNGGKD